jgi:integrase
MRSLTCELVNKFLAHIAKVGKSVHTCRGYRQVILALWNEAYQDGLNDNPPLRVKKIARPRLLVQAFTHKQINALIAQAEKMGGSDKYGNRRSVFWPAAILAGYASGLRRSDLLAVKWSTIEDDGTTTVIQQKTGYPVRVRFDSESLRFMEQLTRPVDRALPWPYDRDFFSRSFRHLCICAGLERGTFKWLRRSGGSYAESVQPGAGSRLLGHRDEGVFRRHYQDDAIARPQAVEPPPIRNGRKTK